MIGKSGEKAIREERGRRLTMHDINETNQSTRQKEPVVRREHVYFWLLLLTSIVTACGILVLVIEFPMVGLMIVSGVVVVLGLVVMRKWIQLTTLRSEQVRVSDVLFYDLQSRVAHQAKEIGLWRMPETYLIDHPQLTTPRVVYFLQKYTLLLPASYQSLDDTGEFLIIRELAHVKRNHHEKRLVLLLGSWVPFLRAAYVRACEETVDRMALRRVSRDVAVRGIISSTVGRTMVENLDMNVYITEKQAGASLATEIAQLFRKQPDVLRRLQATGIDAAHRQTMRWVVRGLVMSGTLVVLFGLAVVGRHVPQLFADLTTFVEQEAGIEQDLGETELMAAIQKGTLEEIEQLLPTSDMQAVDADGDTALHYLGYRKSSKGLEGVFDALIEAGSDVDAINDFGERPFITAVYSNNQELVALYLKQGEKIDQQDEDGYTPLHHAVEGEGKQTVKLLLEKGADPTIKNEEGYTPLMLAEEYELDDIVLLLKQNVPQTL